MPAGLRGLLGTEHWRPPHWFVAGILFAIVAVLLTTAVTGAVRDPDALESGPIVVLSGRDDSLGGQRQALVNQWNELHPDSPARIVELSPIADAQRSEMLARAQGEPGVDVFNLDVTWTAEFAEAGHLLPLADSRRLTGGFLAGPLDTCRYGGQLWALPFNTDVGLLYYRTDLIAEPPRDWETLQRLVGEHAGPGMAGYVGQLGFYEGLTVNALELIRGAGGDVVDAEGRVLADDGDMIAVRTGLERLRAISPPGVPEFDEASSLAEFRAGRALFLRNWPVAYRSLVQDPQEGPTLPFGVAALPAGSAALGGQNLAVAARTERPRAARALIEFLTGDRSEQLLFERGGLPATRSVVYSDPDIAAAVPFVDTLHEALLRARPRPAVPHYARFSEEFRALVDGYLRRRESLDEAVVRERLEAALLGRSEPDAATAETARGGG